MKTTIDREAFDLVFRTLLSCKCPVTAEEESQLFELLDSTAPGETIDFDSVLGIFKPNAITAFRRLADFTTWMVPVGASEVQITREHVIRHFASSYHWTQVVANGLSGAYKKVVSIPPWFMGHMLLPARITEIGEDGISAVYEYANGTITLKSLFAPATYSAEVGQVWGVHFAALLDRFSEKESELVQALGDTNALLVEFRQEVEVIDYSNYERHGDYRAACLKRYSTHYGS